MTTLTEMARGCAGPGHGRPLLWAAELPHWAVLMAAAGFSASPPTNGHDARLRCDDDCASTRRREAVAPTAGGRDINIRIKVFTLLLPHEAKLARLSAARLIQGRAPAPKRKPASPSRSLIVLRPHFCLSAVNFHRPSPPSSSILSFYLCSPALLYQHLSIPPLVSRL